MGSIRGSCAVYMCACEGWYQTSSLITSPIPTPFFFNLRALPAWLDSLVRKSPGAEGTRCWDDHQRPLVPNLHNIQCQTWIFPVVWQTLPQLTHLWSTRFLIHPLNSILLLGGFNTLVLKVVIHKWGLTPTWAKGLSNRWDEEEFLTWRDKGDHYLKKYSNCVFQKTKRKDRKGSQWKDIFFMIETIGTSKFMCDFSNPWISLNKGNWK